MATYSRSQEAGNTLVLKQGDRRSTASKRIRTIEKSLMADLRVEDPTDTLRVLCRTVAELTFLGEELAARLVTGKPVSVELIGRNADRLQRAMKELRDTATGVRIREANRRALEELGDDDDDLPRPRRAPSPPRRAIETVIIDSKEGRRCES